MLRPAWKRPVHGMWPPPPPPPLPPLHFAVPADLPVLDFGLSAASSSELQRDINGLKEFAEAVRSDLSGMTKDIVFLLKATDTKSSKEKEVVENHERLLVRVKTVEERLGKVEGNVFMHSKKLVQLSERNRTLEAIALSGNTGTGKAAIAIRQLFDDARYALASGFMLLFPDAFGQNVRDRYDGDAKSVNWFEFKKSLYSLGQKHYEHTDNTQYRIRSIFESVTIPVGREAPIAFYPSVPNPVKRVELTNEDDSLLFNLQLFASVFIWAFLELKKSILELSNEIADKQSQIRFSMGFLESVKRPWILNEDEKGLLDDIFENDDNLEPRFLYGTAVAFRRDALATMKNVSVRPSEHPRKRNSKGWDAIADGFEDADAKYEVFGSRRKRPSNDNADDSKDFKRQKQEVDGRQLELLNLVDAPIPNDWQSLQETNTRVALHVYFTQLKDKMIRYKGFVSRHRIVLRTLGIIIDPDIIVTALLGSSPLRQKLHHIVYEHDDDYNILKSDDAIWNHAKDYDRYPPQESDEGGNKCEDNESRDRGQNSVAPSPTSAMEVVDQGVEVDASASTVAPQMMKDAGAAPYRGSNDSGHATGYTADYGVGYDGGYDGSSHADCAMDNDGGKANFSPGHHDADPRDFYDDAYARRKVDKMHASRQVGGVNPELKAIQQKQVDYLTTLLSQRSDYLREKMDIVERLLDQRLEHIIKKADTIDAKALLDWMEVHFPSSSVPSDSE